MTNFLLALCLILHIANNVHSTVLLQPLRCFMSDTTCLTTLARSIGPGYIQNVPEIAATAMRLDPMEIDYLLFEKDGLVMELKDTRVYGLKNLIVDTLSAYTNISMGQVKFRTDLLFTGLYKVNGSMFFKPINGEGDYWASFRNLEVELFAPYKIVNNAYGADFIQASNYSFRYDVKDNAQFRLDNLYNGNKELSELMHSLVNINWKYVSAQYSRPVVSKLIDIMAKAYKSYFELVPLKSFVEY